MCDCAAETFVGVARAGDVEVVGDSNGFDLLSHSVGVVLIGGLVIGDVVFVETSVFVAFAKMILRVCFGVSE